MKWLKNILLVGNDWLLHVVVGAYFMYKFGWWGLTPTFISHFFIDMIPHGHCKNDVMDAMKGIVVGVVMGIYTWHIYNFQMAFMVEVGIFVSLSYDFLLVAAKIADQKKIWEKIPAISKTLFFLIKTIVQLNYATHWFGWAKSFNFLWKEKEEFNCGVSGNGIVVSWWNIVQLVVALFVLMIW